ncbi:hypothetical protein [Paenibacillus alkalitolerans]|uniref:hypothetical protein n=1 Tax=Paenibacillus alkalitolerans TaxID=2799335 RepID=UPI0018F3A7BB|nr:hypothetical protein [Paenibacillus alkalitolerans]
MKRNANAWEQVNLAGSIADLKHSHYNNTLAISALIEILIEKGVLTAEEFHMRAARLEQEDDRIATGFNNGTDVSS